MTLDQLLEKARKREDAMAMNEVMYKKDGEKEKLNRVKQRYPFKGPHQRKEETQEKGKYESKGRDEEQCLRCGSRRHKTRAECPALGKKCDFCKKTGHFAKVCFKKLVNNIKEKPTQSDTDETVYDGQVAKVAESDPVHLTSNTNVEYGQATTDDQIFNVGTRPVLVKAKMDGRELTWQPDTGATRDIMNERHLREYEKEVGRKVTLSPYPLKLFAYGSNRSLELVGQFQAVLRAGEKSLETTIIVTKEASSYPLLSENSLRKLGLVQYNEKFLVQQIDEKRDLAEVRRKCAPA
jgi:hypothetical protein